ncbi:MAG: MBL fold metallo-hydrolase, partial [Bacteroidales bacterium]|nr:MBL fold metallo-hydrolase [Bacteroidales bacterium]
MKIINKITTLLVALLLMNINLFSQVKMNSENNQQMNKESKIVEKNTIIMTVLYDNYVYSEGTKNAWGFSCFIEGTEKNILFDTGGEGKVLMHNIDKLNINPESVETIVISHNHWDHTGGLFTFLEKKSGIPVYLPHSFPGEFIDKVKDAGASVIL